MRKLRRSVPVLFCSFLLLGGCGGGGSGTTEEKPSVGITLSIGGNVALGPVADANVTVSRLSGSELFSAKSAPYDELADTTEHNATARKLKPFAEQGVGKFRVEQTRSWWPSDDEIVLLRVRGGTDMDPDDDGYVETGEPAPLEGTLLAYVRFGDLKEGNVTVNLLSTAAARILYARHQRDAATISAVLDGAARQVFAADPAEGGAPTWRSLYRFNPALLEAGAMLHAASLLEESRYETVRQSTFTQSLYAGETPPADSDGEGLADGFEILVGSDPHAADSDGDGVNDYAEVWAGSSPIEGSDAGEDPLFEHQWHLLNTGQSAGAANGGTPGEDIGISPLDPRYAGTGEVVVALVDEGAEYWHPDLRGSIDIALSYNYESRGLDPEPTGPHGTACAGIIAAQGWNGKGVRGVAPMTRIAVLTALSSIPSLTGTMSDLADALARPGMDISSNSWGPPEAGTLTEWPSLVDAVETGTAQGRGGKGTVYVFAAGNDRTETQHGNANTSLVHNSKSVITVAAVNAEGRYSSYSNAGANVLLAAPGGEYGVIDPAIVTTDLTGYDAGYDTSTTHFNVAGNEESRYTNRMDGTSAATPIVAGVCALVLQANPALTWRDVKYILARTARRNDPASPEWTENGAGFHVSHDYGFGTVDASAAVAMAEGFAGLPAEAVTPVYEQSPGVPIPDNNVTGVTATITVSENLSVEHVDVWFDASDHPRIDDLEIVLISPSGTESILAWGGESFMSFFEEYRGWRFSTVRCLDESSAGAWRLVVRDRAAAYTGTFKNWKLQISGH